MKVTTIKSPAFPKLRAGMTLLEIVIVLGIIALIMAASIGALGGVKAGAKDVTARMKISGIATTLETYKLLAGSYPTESQGLEALVNKPTSSPAPRKWKQQMQSLPTDPWQNEFVYKYPGSRDRSTYEIISKGEDGALGSDDDISSQDPQ